jgi:hypothetical protein
MSAKIYLAHAAQERAAASKATLPNRRAMHERSAEVWEEMARNADATAAMAEVNLLAKAQ